MYIIIWEYHIEPESRAEFVKTYSPHGDWAELFKKGGGYAGTELLQDESNPQRYLTIDRWESMEEYETFLSQWEEEYKALDAQCEGLTESESLLGKWETFSS